MSYSIKSQLQEEKEARLNKTPEKEARGNMKLMGKGKGYTAVSASEGS